MLSHVVPRDYDLREQIPVPHDNHFQSIYFKLKIVSLLVEPKYFVTFDGQKSSAHLHKV